MKCASAFFAIAAVQLAAFAIVFGVGEGEGKGAQAYTAQYGSSERLTLDAPDEFAIRVRGQTEQDFSQLEQAAALQPTMSQSREWVIVSEMKTDRGKYASEFRPLPVRHVLNEPKEMLGAVYRFTYVEAVGNDGATKASEAARYSF